MSYTEKTFNLKRAYAAEYQVRRTIAWLTLRAERLAPAILTVVVIGMFVVAMFKARYKFFWYDELLSVSAAKLPHLSDIWSFTETVPDGQPPLYYCLLHASRRLFGNDPWGIRAPSTLGYVVFCVSLYWFVSRQTSKLYGLVAVLLAGMTGVWYYATEGRPYALVLGCAGVAAVCWQSIVLDRARKRSLAGLSLSLLCAFSFHYFSALLVVPFAMAEFVRTLNRRKVDLAVWFSFALQFVLLIPYLPVMRGARANAGTGIFEPARPTWSGSLIQSARVFLDSTLVALIIIGCLYMVWRILPYGRTSKSHDEDESATLGSEFLAITALILSLTCVLPVLGVAFGRFVSHQFYPRYVIASMIGLVSLMTGVMWLAFSRRKEPALIIALLLSCLFFFRAISDVRFAQGERSNPLEARIRKHIPAVARRDNLPIVAANAFMELTYYSGPGLSQRMYYVTCEECALRFEGYNMTERAMALSAPYFGTRVLDYKAFIQKYSNFYIIGGPRWIVPRLVEDGAHLQLIKGGTGDSPTDEIDYIFRVTLPGR